MANPCWNVITFTASEEALTWLETELKRLEGLYDNGGDPAHALAVYELFANEERFGSDGLGARYVKVFRFDNFGDYLTMECESAWHCPTKMIENIVELLQEKSGDTTVVADGHYYEEGVGFAGIFRCDKEKGYRNDETDLPEYDEFEDDFDFEEDVLRPTLNELSVD